MGFFSQSSLMQTETHQSTIPKCGLCGLYKRCKSPKMKVTGEGRKRILIVGEAPGKDEDHKGKQFVGRTGQYQENVLKELGIDMRQDCWLTNSLICRPSNNATLTDEQIEYCHPNLTQTIKDLKPDIIIPVGRAAVESVLKGIWKDPIETMGRWVGWQIPCRDLNAWICPVYHPSYILHELELAKLGTPIELLYKQHLNAAIRLEGKPYRKPIDLKDKVRVLVGTREPVHAMQRFIKDGGPVAVDYETNMLKPDDTLHGKIISTSICWRGRDTIAFPFVGYSKEWFIRLLQANNPKIAHGLKFEDRWTKAVLGCEVKNWVWDTMNNAHILDNRKDKVCGLSFQAFVMLGVGSYDSHIKPFLEQEHSYGVNRIKEIDIYDLLTYNGLDALVCYKLAVKQRKLLGLERL